MDNTHSNSARGHYSLKTHIVAEDWREKDDAERRAAEDYTCDDRGGTFAILSLQENKMSAMWPWIIQTGVEIECGNCMQSYVL